MRQTQKFDSQKLGLFLKENLQKINQIFLKLSVSEKIPSTVIDLLHKPLAMMGKEKVIRLLGNNFYGLCSW